MSSGLRLTFTLAESDAAELRRALQGVAIPARIGREDELVRAARQRLRQALDSGPLDFVRERLHELEATLQMLEDKDWLLPGSVRRRILVLLAYLADTSDLVPDRTPVFGYLDDALLVHLLMQEIGEELDGYRDFARWRERASARSGSERFEQELTLKRKALRARIQGRRMRREDRAGRLFSLFGR